MSTMMSSAFESTLRRADYILRGPLVEACGFTAEAVSDKLSDWQHYGKEAARSLGFGGIDALDDIQKCAPTMLLSTHCVAWARHALSRAGAQPICLVLVKFPEPRPSVSQAADLLVLSPCLLLVSAPAEAAPDFQRGSWCSGAARDRHQRSPGLGQEHAGGAAGGPVQARRFNSCRSLHRRLLSHLSGADVMCSHLLTEALRQVTTTYCPFARVGMDPLWK